MLLETAKSHFLLDTARARALVEHASSLAPGELSDDILRAAWMMSVGASDAYFCDAYTDLISRALRAKDLEPVVAIPDRLNNLRIPVAAILRPTTGGWRWRMAARELMEDDNVLSFEKIRGLFNHFFRTGHKLLNQETIEPWILHRDAMSRMFGITGTRYRALAPQDKPKAKKKALAKLEERFKEIFQRRHDCIHNCDRPKTALQPITCGTVTKVIEDIEFLVLRCNDSLAVEFQVYLKELGFTATARNQVCQ